jgi:hypothetical protein
MEVDMPESTRWVAEYPEGGWAVVGEDRQRVSDVLDTQAQAMDRGHEIVRNLGGGELIVQGRDGEIRDKITVAPGPDDPDNPG